MAGKPAPKPIERLFIALWPDATVQEELAALSRGGGCRWRPVPAHNLHLTLVFIGDADVQGRRCVERACDRVRGSTVSLVLQRVRYRSRGGLVWAEPAQTPPPLLNLVDALNHSLAECGYVPERRPYRAHVTLARGARRGSTCPPMAPIHWVAEDFCLVKSVLTPDGARYEVLRRWVFARDYTASGR